MTFRFLSARSIELHHLLVNLTFLVSFSVNLGRTNVLVISVRSTARMILTDFVWVEVKSLQLPVMLEKRHKSRTGSKLVVNKGNLANLIFFL